MTPAGCLAGTPNSYLRITGVGPLKLFRYNCKKNCRNKNGSGAGATEKPARSRQFNKCRGNLDIFCCIMKKVDMNRAETIYW